jgi:antitoxin PrlF
MSAVIAGIGRRGQVTIPRTVRRRLGIQEGDQVAFLLAGDHVILYPLPKTLLDMRGSVPVGMPQDFSEIRRQAIEAHARKVAQDEA